MKGNRTLTILKPDAVAGANAGNIIQHITDAGFKIIAMKYLWITREQAEKFYAIHRERPFFTDLVNFMISGPVIPAILEKENAVESFRTLIGATNPANAAEGTIRKLYAESIEKNAVHGSDSDDNALVEGSFFFSQLEQF